MTRSTPRRIIVCGCRDWSDAAAVNMAIASVFTLWPEHDHVIVHGDCPRGADAMAEAFCKSVGVPTERHPADWEHRGKGAGFMRNAEMADAGADLCLSFWDGKSPGSLDMIRRATAAGIQVRIVPAKKASP